MNYTKIPKVNIKVKSNERLYAIPFIKQVDEWLDSYYEDIGEQIVGNVVIEDRYKIIDDFVNSVSNNLDDDDKVFIYNYIYKYKGSIQSIIKLCQMLNINVDVDNTYLDYENGKLTITINRVYTSQLDKFRDCLLKLCYELLYFDESEITINAVIISFIININFVYKYASRNVLNLLTQPSEIDILPKQESTDEEPE